MIKLFSLVGFISILLSCNAQSSQKNKNNSSANKTTAMVEDKDYFIVKRFRVEDKQGFDNPVEVSSFVLPAGWQVNSNV